MKIDCDALDNFEKALNPLHPEDSPIQAKILGYGEISTIFQIGDDNRLAYKRMPMFDDRQSAEIYSRNYDSYCRYLTEAGIHLPPDETAIIELPERPVTLYIAQHQFPAEQFGHKLIHHLPEDQVLQFIEQVVIAISRIWQYNRTHKPQLEIAIDGQISNWVLDQGQLLYIDTSTPLFRVDGVEQLEPELLLKSAPSFLLWIIRLLFLKDVMNRYYEPRLVYSDLAANLYKEQRSDLIGETINIINKYLADDQPELTEQEIARYYQQDKIIWKVFLHFRKIDRWLKTRIFHQRYDFILPGKIKR